MSGEGPFNHYWNMSCSQSQFTRELSDNPEGARVLELSDWTDNAPEYARTFLEESSTCLGFVVKGKLVSCAHAPNIYLGNEALKFAIIRGVWTDPSHRGKDFATSSMNALCRALFDEVKVDEIFLRVEERNPAAIKIYKKLGFRVTGKWLGSQCQFK